MKKIRQLSLAVLSTICFINSVAGMEKDLGEDPFPCLGRAAQELSERNLVENLGFFHIDSAGGLKIFASDDLRMEGNFTSTENLTVVAGGKVEMAGTFTAEKVSIIVLLKQEQ